MQNGTLPRVYASMQEAIREIRANAAANDTIRIGLAGVAVAPSQVARAVFLPCRNVGMAATQLATLSERCKTHPRLKSDPTFCAVAVYRGSWEKPDVDFADAVEISFVRGNAPNLDLSNDSGIEFLDIASDMLAVAVVNWIRLAWRTESGHAGRDVGSHQTDLLCRLRSVSITGDAGS
jgi:hypothetical protein